MKLSELPKNTVLIVSPCLEKGLSIIATTPLERPNLPELAQQHVDHNVPFIFVTAGEMVDGYRPTFDPPDVFGLGNDLFLFEMARKYANKGLDSAENIEIALQCSEKILNSNSIGEA